MKTNTGRTTFIDNNEIENYRIFDLEGSDTRDCSRPCRQIIMLRYPE